MFNFLLEDYCSTSHDFCSLKLTDPATRIRIIKVPPLTGRYIVGKFHCSQPYCILLITLISLDRLSATRGGLRPMPPISPTGLPAKRSYAEICYFLFFLNCSTKYRTTAIINSQAFLPKNPITSPAVLNRKLTIAPTIPGNISLSFLPIALNPLPTPLPKVDKPLRKIRNDNPNN